MMKEPISLDTALQIVGSLKVRAIKEKSTLTNLVEKDALDQKIKMYLKEECYMVLMIWQGFLLWIK